MNMLILKRLHHLSVHPGSMDIILSMFNYYYYLTHCFLPRIPVHNLYTLRDHLIAFAGSHHVVIMDIKKREQHVGGSCTVLSYLSILLVDTRGSPLQCELSC